MSGSGARSIGGAVGRAALRTGARLARRTAGRLIGRVTDRVTGRVNGPGDDGADGARPDPDMRGAAVLGTDVLGADGGLRAARDPRGLRRGRALTFAFDGRPVMAHEGETVGAALLAAGIRTLRETRFDGRPRGLLCGIGSCHDCLVGIDGSGPVRACLTPVADGMRVSTHRPGGPGFDPAAVDLRGWDEA